MLLILLAPFALFVATLLTPQRYRFALTVAGMALVWLLLWPLVSTMINEGRLSMEIRWVDSLGLGLRVDGLALVFILLTALICTLCGLQARVYFADQPGFLARFLPLFWGLWGGLNAVWMARDLFTLYLSMEWLACCATLLITLRGEKASLAAALRYLQAVLLGTLAFLLGAALLFIEYGSFAFTDIQAQLNDAAKPALLLITVGLIYRAALFPLHSWLPPAHGSSHAPVSALLSAMVTKASFYILMRIWLEGGHQLASPAFAQFLGALGATAIIWGGWQAWRQSQLKMLIAYSSVNQIGYFFLLFPLLVGTPEVVANLARNGVILQILSHALAKAALFLAAGNLIMACGSDQIRGLSGVSRYLPLSLFSFGLAGVSLMGLPPSGGFAAKWSLLQAVILSGQWWWAVVLIVGGLLSAAYVFQVFRQSFLPRSEHQHFSATPLYSDLAPFILATLAVSLGLLGIWPLTLIELGGS